MPAGGSLGVMSRSTVARRLFSGVTRSNKIYPRRTLSGWSVSRLSLNDLCHATRIARSVLHVVAWVSIPLPPSLSFSCFHLVFIFLPSTRVLHSLLPFLQNPFLSSSPCLFFPSLPLPFLFLPFSSLYFPARFFSHTFLPPLSSLSSCFSSLLISSSFVGTAAVVTSAKLQASESKIKPAYTEMEIFKKMPDHGQTRNHRVEGTQAW